MALIKNPKHTAVILLKCLLVVLLFWGLSRASLFKFDLIFALLKAPLDCILIVGFCLLSVFFSAWRYRMLNSAQGIKLGLLKTVEISYIGAAFNLLLPGAVGGDIIKMHTISKLVPHKKNSIFFSIIFDRVIGLVSVLFILCFMGLLQTYADKPQLVTIMLTCFGACGGMCLLVLGFMFLPQRKRLSDFLAQQFGRVSWLRLLVTVFSSLGNYQLKFVDLLKCLATSFIAQFSMIAAVFTIAHAMHFPVISIDNYAIAMGVSQIINLIPITPGGIGVGELAFAKVIMLLNPGVMVPFATVFFAYRLISGLVYFPGLIYYGLISLLKPGIRVDSEQATIVSD